MEARSKSARLAVLGGAAIPAVMLALQVPHAAADPVGTLYDRCPAAPPAVIGAGGIGESLGGRDSYEVADLNRALSHPAEYYARKVRFRTQATNRIICLHWGCALGTQQGSLWYGGPDPEGILHVPGTSRWSATPPPDAAAGTVAQRPLSLAVEAWGLVDSYPTLWDFTDCGSMATAQLVDATALSAISPKPATPHEWETTLSPVADASAEDRLDLLAYRLQWTREPEVARREIADLERALAKRSPDDYRYQDFWFRLGRLHQEYTHDFDKASRCYRMVYRRRGTGSGFNGAAVVRDGECRETLGRAEDARAIYRRLIEQQPRNFWATDALQHLAKWRVSPTSLSVDLSREEAALFQEAIRRCRLGDAVGELKILNRLRAAERRDPWILLHRVIAEHTHGRPEAAQADLKLLSAIDSATYSTAKRLLSYLTPLEPRDSDAAAIEIPDLPPGNGEDRPEIPADTEDRHRQAVVVLCRDHLARYPSDPLPHLVRTAVWADTPRISHLGVDGAHSLDRAIALAPGSLAVHLFAYRLATGRWGYRLDGRRYGASEIVAAARGLLHTHPEEAGPLHRELALYYRARGSRALASYHRKAYGRWLRQRDHVGQSFPR